MQIMNAEEEIKWVTLTLNFPPNEEARLEARAKTEGLSVKCYCLRVLLKHLAEESETEQWQRKFDATLRRNGCHDGTKAGSFETLSE
jgi:hypothetical protein